MIRYGHRRLISAALLCAGAAAAGMADAQVRVRSGEHGAFTRLVVDFPERPDWTLRARPGGLDLLTGVENARGFDLSDVFRRIPRDRVSGIRDAPGGSLAIDLACACGARTLELPNGGLVIDIGEGFDAVPGPNAPDPARSAIRPIVGYPSWYAGRATPVAVPPSDPDTIDAPEPAADRDLVLERLAEALAETASRGLVDAGEPAAATPPAQRDEDAAPASLADADVPPVPAPTGTANMRVRSSMNRDDLQAAFGDDAQCWPASFVDLASWAPGAGQEDDAQVWRAEARAFLHRGFGAEAFAVLRDADAGDAESERQALLALAGVMDDDTVEPALARQGGCDTSAAVLAPLAVPPGALPDPLDPAALRRQFSALPPHLRDHLGPRVVARLIAGGAPDLATAIGAATLRGAPADEDERRPETRLMAARIDRTTRDDSGPPPDDAPVERAAMSAKSAAAEAMRLLLASRIADGAPISPQLLAQAEVIVFSAEPEVARDISLSLVTAHANAGAIDRAFDVLGRTKVTGPEQRRQVTGEIETALNAIGPDDAFLRAVSAHLVAGRAPPPKGIALARASRLLGLDLPEMARSVLEGLDDVPSRDERLLRARIHLALGESALAQSYLAGLDGEPALRLVREADRAMDRATPLVPAASPGDDDPSPTREAGAGQAARDALDRGRRIADETAAFEAELAEILDR